VLNTVDAALGELLEERRLVLPKSITARQFMQMVMRGEIEPSPKQFNAAKALIEYEEPKLSAVAVGHVDGNSFAQALEKSPSAKDRQSKKVRRSHGCLVYHDHIWLTKSSLC
jgi:hypothetical protein